MESEKAKRKENKRKDFRMTQPSSKALPCSKIEPGQEQLTLKQEAYVYQFSAERIAAQLSCTPIDEQEAEDHLCRAYRVAGLEPPRMNWVDSPLSLVHGPLPQSVWASVLGKTWVSEGNTPLPWAARTAVDIIAIDIKDSVLTRATESIRESVEESVMDTTWASGENSTGGSRRANLPDLLWASVRGYAQGKWFAPYRFLHEAYEETPLIHLALFNEMVSGYWLGKNEAWLVRKPRHLHHDGWSLHDPQGMCVEYRDGWGFYAWHGTRVPEQLIRPSEHLAREG
jgi:hypothetical protein